MAALLKGQPLCLPDLCQAMDLSPAEALDHLGHLKKSLKSRFGLKPAYCQGCGFVFKNRSRLNPPGRCPKCRGQRISGPWFFVG
jgi:predicted Zn-ribbon and HTH transcriptional regulator